MIFDCFSFFNEVDILDIRLHILADVVDRFVLVEAKWTHTGEHKPLFFAENKELFAPFLDKIIHVVVDDNDLPIIPANLSTREIAWIRENTQRNAISKGLSGANENDILIISDLDEIPDPQVISSVSKQLNGVVNLSLRNYSFFLNNFCITTPSWIGGPQILTFATFKNPETYRGFVFNEYVPLCANSIPSATVIRHGRKKKLLKNAGWHFSSMGGTKAIQQKLNAFAHTEFALLAKDSKEIERRLLKGDGLFGYGDKFMLEPINLHMPPFVIENAGRVANFLRPTTARAWRRNAMRRHLLRFQKHVHDAFLNILFHLIPQKLHPHFKLLRKRFFSWL